MSKKIQKRSILFVIISVSILLLMKESYAEINVELLRNPEVTTIEVGSEPIALVANASGANLQFKWELLGPGEFEGSTTSSAIHYIPPEEITRSSAKATITVKVSDDQDNEATAGITFKIIPQEPENEVSPTPSSDPSPTPTIGIVITQGEVKITEPEDGTAVGSSETITGIYTEEIQDDIWVALWPEKAPDRGYFQSNDPAAGAPASKRSGQWSVICHFGGPPQSFKIAVYTATSAASKFIKEKLQEWNRKGSFPGLTTDELPNGLEIRDRIKVNKK